MTIAAHPPGHTPREAGTSGAVAALFDLLGRRGALRLLWELRDGHNQSFRLLRASADGISPSVLNTRLKELREAGLVELGEAGYGLTPQSLELVRHLKPLNRWAQAWASGAGPAPT